MNHQSNKVYVGNWDCEYCGHTEIHGPSAFCPQCGSRRSENVEFYLRADAVPVTEKNKIDQALSGPDWACSNCSTTNKNKSKFCETCGSPHNIDEQDVNLAIKKHVKDNIKNQKKNNHPPSTMKQKKGAAKEAKIAGTVITSGVILSLLTAIDKPITVTVTEHEWKRTLYYEHYKEVEEKGWKLPEKAKKLEQFKAIHHHDRTFKGYETKTRTVQEIVGSEQYTCGQTDLGNGYFQDRQCSKNIYQDKEESYQESIYEDVPVYDIKYRYNIYRWKSEEPIVTSGNDNNPVWGTKNELNNPEKYKITKRVGQYHIHYTEEDGTLHTNKVRNEHWKKLKIGSQLPAVQSSVYGYYKGLNIPVHQQAETIGSLNKKITTDKEAK